MRKYVISALRERDKGRLISRDVQSEPPDRLFAIRHALERVTSKDFGKSDSRVSSSCLSAVTAAR